MQIFKRFCASNFTSVRPPVAFKYKVTREKNKSQVDKFTNDQKTNLMDKDTYQRKSNFIANGTSRQKINFIDKDISQQKASLNDDYVSSDLLSVCGPKSRKGRVKDTSSKNEIVYGIYPVLLALQTQRRTFMNLYYKNITLESNSKLNEIYKLCQLYNVPTYCVDKKKFINLVGHEKVHQGVCLEASKLPFLIYETLNEEEKLNFEMDKTEKLKLWLYLDQVNDPMNLGAILRTAYYLGVDKVFTSQTNSCPISNVVSKASAGVAEMLPVYQIRDVDNFTRMLQEKDWHILSSVTNANNTISVDEFKSSKNIFLVVGNEGRGVSSKMEESSNHLITIPPSEACVEDMQSLNVSVATSIILYSLLTKLKQNC